MADIICPRCGYRNSFFPSKLPGTCTCSMCQSQLDWRQIPNCGPDCRPMKPSEPAAEDEPKPPLEETESPSEES